MYQPTRPVHFPPLGSRRDSDLRLANIQGDILTLGFVKKSEDFFFFQIVNKTLFKQQFAAFAEKVTNVPQAIKTRKAVYEYRREGNKTLLPVIGVNISFSHKGLKELGLSLEDDSHFTGGQKAEAVTLGDNLNEWREGFLQENDVIHGVILVAGESREHVDAELASIKALFGLGGGTPSVKGIDTVKGDARPEALHANEHFGFLDGISEPRIIGYDDQDMDPKEPQAIKAGFLITGYDGDPVNERPEWQRDGSYLVFRYLSQKVPEFQEFLDTHPIEFPGVQHGEDEGDVEGDHPPGSDLLGARLVGRWKSGAPLDLAPFRDHPELSRSNSFKFTAQQGFQRNCPIASHVRKMFPRDDLPNFSDSFRMLRRGIQFGIEVTEEEKRTKQTSEDRGLLFVCYQTSIARSFFFVQNSWANNPNFPSRDIGLDPIIGQGVRNMSGFDPDDPQRKFDSPLDRWVISGGGEYFFSPSLDCLKNTIPTSA